jgi:hypothetical protein
VRLGFALALAASMNVAAMERPAARILSVEHLDGLPGRIIEPPREVLDEAIASGTHTLGFDERQDVGLERPLELDDGRTIPAGAVVSSHMILLNLPDGSLGAWSRTRWTFDAPILGVMSDHGGRLEAQSSALLGAPGTTYPSHGFRYRGIEDGDAYDGVGSAVLTLTFRVWQPGDWIRVITGSAPVARDDGARGQPAGGVYAGSMIPSAR